VSTSLFLTRSAQERFYHPELDVLRFFSFFFIFIHHSMPHDPTVYIKMGVAPAIASALAALGAAGAFGVQLFFLLSAYLVTELLIRERALRGQVDLKPFYLRRSLRIFPLYFFFLALAWAMQWLVPGQHIGWRALLAFTFLVGNWWVVFVGFPSSVIFPLWFVSLQEQFYFFWPATMRKLSVRGLILAPILMLTVASLTRWYLAVRHTWESRLWANTFVQLDGMAFGILLAVLLAGRAPRLAALHRLALFAGGITCFFLAGSYFVIKGDPLTVSRVLLGYPVAAIGAVALFLATLNDGGPFKPSSGLSGEPSAAAGAAAFAAYPAAKRALPTRVFTAFAYLGQISFGLYVFHILGLMTSDYTVQHQDSSLGRYLFRNAVALAVTIVLAAISYRLLESPFLTLKQRFTRVSSR
jgi:peptidoglycan/LPS O-acetylase OafA/YrhL